MSELTVVLVHTENTSFLNSKKFIFQSHWVLNLKMMIQEILIITVIHRYLVQVKQHGKDRPQEKLNKKTDTTKLLLLYELNGDDRLSIHQTFIQKEQSK
jgi:hypothetical protein